MPSADDIRLRNLIEQRGLLSRGDLDACTKLVDEDAVHDMPQAIRTQDLLPEPTLHNLLEEAGIADEPIGPPVWRRMNEASAGGRSHTEASGRASSNSDAVAGNGSRTATLTNGQLEEGPEMSASGLDAVPREEEPGEQAEPWEGDEVEWAGAETSDGDPFQGLSPFPAEAFNGEEGFLGEQAASAEEAQAGTSFGEQAPTAPDSSSTAPVPLDALDPLAPSASESTSQPAEDEESSYYQPVSEEAADDFVLESTPRSVPVDGPASEETGERSDQPGQAARVHLPGSDVQPSATGTPGTTSRTRKVSWEQLRLGGEESAAASPASSGSGASRRSAPVLPAAGSEVEPPELSNDREDLSRAHLTSEASQSQTPPSAATKSSPDTSWAESSPEWRTEAGEQALPEQSAAGGFSAELAPLESSDEVPMVSYEALLAADQQASPPSELAPLEPTPEESALLQSDVFMFGSGALSEETEEAPSEFFEHIRSESQRLERLDASASPQAESESREEEAGSSESTARTLAEQALAHLQRAEASPKRESQRKPAERTVQGRDAYDLEGCTLGRVRLLEKVGHGATGCVYRGEDQRMHREVAVKVMPRAFASDPTSRERFIQEAITLAKFEPHTNIVAVYDVDEEDGLVYLVMQFVRGASLADLIRRRGVMSEYQTVAIIRQVLQALDYAHGKGLVHRDIKPDNILITDDGTAKLTDFGLARQLGRESGMTQSGAVVGTPYYIAPEAIDSTESDGRADLFAIGVTLYECLTGNRPFSGPNVQAVLLRIVSEAPVSPRERNPKISEALEEIILKLLAKDPTQRFPSAAAVLTAFSEWSPDDALSAISDRFAATGRSRRVPVETFPTPPGRSGHTSRHHAAQAPPSGEAAAQEPPGGGAAQPSSPAGGHRPSPTPPLGLPAEPANEWGHGTSIDEEMLAQAFTPDMLEGVDESDVDGDAPPAADTAKEELPAIEGGEEAFAERAEVVDAESWRSSATLPEEDAERAQLAPAPGEPAPVGEPALPAADEAEPRPDTPVQPQSSPSPSPATANAEPSKLKRFPSTPAMRSGSYAFGSGRSRPVQDEETAVSPLGALPRSAQPHESSGAATQRGASSFPSRRQESSPSYRERPLSQTAPPPSARATHAEYGGTSPSPSPRRNAVASGSDSESSAAAIAYGSESSSATYLAERSGSSATGSKPSITVTRRSQERRGRRRRGVWHSEFLRYLLGVLLLAGLALGGYYYTVQARPAVAHPPALLPADTLVYVEAPGPKEVLERIKESRLLFTPLDAVEGWEERLDTTLLESGRGSGHLEGPSRLWRQTRGQARQTTLALVPTSSAATAEAEWVWMFSGLEPAAVDEAFAGYVGASKAEPIRGAQGQPLGYVVEQGELPWRAAAFVGKQTLVVSRSPEALRRVVALSEGTGGYSLQGRAAFRRWWKEKPVEAVPPSNVRLYVAAAALDERTDVASLPAALQLAVTQSTEQITASSRSHQGVAGTAWELVGPGMPLLDVPLEPLTDERMLEALGPDAQLVLAGRVEPSRRGILRLYRWLRSLGEPVRTDMHWLLEPMLRGSIEEVERFWSGEFAWARNADDQPLLVLGVRGEPSSEEVREMLTDWMPPSDQQGYVRIAREQCWALTPARLVVVGMHPEAVATARHRLIADEENLRHAPAYRRLRPGLDADSELLIAWRLDRFLADSAGISLARIERDAAISADQLVMLGVTRTSRTVNLRLTLDDFDLTAILLASVPQHGWGEPSEDRESVPISVPASHTLSELRLEAAVNRANVELSWPEPEVEVSHLLLERRLADGRRDRSFEAVAHLPPEARSYTDLALLGEQPYEYRLALRELDGTVRVSPPTRISVPRHTQSVAPPHLAPVESLTRTRTLLGTRYHVVIDGRRYTVGDVLYDRNDEPFRIAGVRTQGDRLHLTLVGSNGASFPEEVPQPSDN